MAGRIVVSVLNPDSSRGVRDSIRPVEASVSELLASEEPPRGDGEFWAAGCFRYREGRAPWAIRTAGGVSLTLLPRSDGSYDFGGLRDGDDQAAFWRLQALAKAISPNPATKAVFHFERGEVYQYTDPFWLTDIPGLVLNGNGCTFQNVSANRQAANKLFTQHHGFNSSVDASDGFIPVRRDMLGKNAAPGDMTVTLASDADAYSVGEWVCLASWDQQFSGAPANYRYFSFHKIAAIDGQVLTFEAAVRHAHQTDLPYLSSYRNGDGRAHVHKIEQAFRWDIDHTYNDITFLKGGAATIGSAYASGRSVTFNRCTAGRFIMGTVQRARFNQCTHTGESGAFEADKCVGSVVVDGGRIDRLSECTGADSMTFRDVEIANGTDARPRCLRLEDVTINKGGSNIAMWAGVMPCDLFHASGGYIEDLPAITASSHIASIAIDGSDVSWVGGVLTLTKVATSDGNAQRKFLNGCEPGRRIHMIESGSCAALASGVVTRVSGGDDTAAVSITFDGTVATGDTLGWYNEPVSCRLDAVRTAGGIVSRDYLGLPN